MLIPSSVKIIEYEDIDLGDRHNAALQNETAAKLLNDLLPSQGRLVTIDGFDGTGKSALAKALGKIIGAEIISLDDFLEKQQGHFLTAVKYGALNQIVLSALEKGKPVILEGCLVQAVIKRLKLESSFRAYIMKTSQMFSVPEHEWADEREILYDEISTNELITKLEEQAKKFDHSSKMSGLTKELIHYHRDYRPHDIADVIVKRVRKI